MSYFGWDLTAKWNRIEGYIGMDEVRIQDLNIEYGRWSLIQWSYIYVYDGGVVMRGDEME